MPVDWFGLIVPIKERICLKSFEIDHPLFYVDSSCSVSGDIVECDSAVFDIGEFVDTLEFWLVQVSDIAKFDLQKIDASFL
jgi:hypothetical protein